MHKYTAFLLSLIAKAAKLGRAARDYLLSLHIEALTRLVEKADDEAASIRRAVDRLRDKAVDAECKAAEVADMAVAEAAKHGVTLDV